jgi:hypothetical protein
MRDHPEHAARPARPPTARDVSGSAAPPSARTETADSLPKTLPGTVHTQWVRCGKSSCRCARGELHGPYHYHFWRENGRLRKRYVKPDDVAEVRARCAERQKLHRALVQARARRRIAHRVLRACAGRTLDPHELARLRSMLERPCDP